MTQPLKPTQQRAARNIAEKAAKFLEAHLSPNSTRLETTATPKQRKGKMGAKQTSSASSSTGIGLRSGVS
ncbi:hypothetical protein GGI19_006128, partial [Coemansia pectinata]